MTIAELITVEVRVKLADGTEITRKVEESHSDLSRLSYYLGEAVSDLIHHTRSDADRLRLEDDFRVGLTPDDNAAEGES